MIHSDSATAERAVQHLQKMIGVRAAVAFPSREGVARELALVKVRAPLVARLFTITVSLEVPDPVTVVGLKVAVTREPSPVTLRLTVPVNPFTAPIVTV